MKKVFAKNRSEWRAWLEKHHKSAEEAWLVFYKKATGKPSIAYMESVEEAICFGWIDGLKKGLDEETYTHRFSPRRRNSRSTSPARMVPNTPLNARSRRVFSISAP